MAATSIVNVRSEPDLNAPVVWVLSPGQSFTVGERQGNWYPVFPADSDKDVSIIGFVSRKVIAPADADTPRVDWGDVRYIGSNVKYQLKRSTASPSGGTLKAGDRVKVGFLHGGWYAVFKGDVPVHSEDQAFGYVKKNDVDVQVDHARILYAVRKINVFEKPIAGSKQVGILSPGHRAQVGKEKGGMYALYRIDTIVQDDTPVWGYAWGPFLVAYPKNLEKAEMAGIDARKAEIAEEKKEKENAAKERKNELDAMEKAMQEMLDAPLPTKTMYAMAVMNVRSEPDANSLIVEKIEPGQAVLVGADEGKWYPVFTRDMDKKLKRIGYVFGTYLQAEPLPERKEEKTAKKRLSVQLMKCLSK